MPSLPRAGSLGRALQPPGWVGRVWGQGPRFPAPALQPAGSGALTPLPRGCPRTGLAAPCPAFGSADPLRVGTVVHGTAAGERHPHPQALSCHTQACCSRTGCPLPWPAPTACGRFTSGLSAATQAGRRCGVVGDRPASPKGAPLSVHPARSHPVRGLLAQLPDFIDKCILGFFLTETLNAQCGKTWKQPESARLPLLAWTAHGPAARGPVPRCEPGRGLSVEPRPGRGGRASPAAGAPRGSWVPRTAAP